LALFSILQVVLCNYVAQAAVARQLPTSRASGWRHVLLMGQRLSSPASTGRCETLLVRPSWLFCPT